MNGIKKMNGIGDHHCGALDENDHHRLPNLNIWLPVVNLLGMFRRCGPGWKKSVTEAVFECKNPSLAYSLLSLLHGCGSRCKLSVLFQPPCLCSSIVNSYPSGTMSKDEVFLPYMALVVVLYLCNRTNKIRQTQQDTETMFCFLSQFFYVSLYGQDTVAPTSWTVARVSWANTEKPRGVTRSHSHCWWPWGQKRKNHWACILHAVKAKPLFCPLVSRRAHNQLESIFKVPAGELRAGFEHRLPESALPLNIGF